MFLYSQELILDKLMEIRIVAVMIRSVYAALFCTQFVCHGN
jgi:hypothetical protein